MSCSACVRVSACTSARRCSAVVISHWNYNSRTFGSARDPTGPSPGLTGSRNQCLFGDCEEISFWEPLIQWIMLSLLFLVWERIGEPHFSPWSWCVPNDVLSVLTQLRALSKPKVSLWLFSAGHLQVPQTKKQKGSQWKRADESYKGWSLEKIRSAFLGKSSTCFCCGSLEKPVKSKVSS